MAYESPSQSRKLNKRCGPNKSGGTLIRDLRVLFVMYFCGNGTLRKRESPPPVPITLSDINIKI